jgi:hypothetical protein
VDLLRGRSELGASAPGAAVVGRVDDCDADDGCDDDDDCDEEVDDAGTSGGDEAAASSTSSSSSTTNSGSSEYRRASRVDLLSVRSELGAGTTGAAVAAGVDDVDEDCDDRVDDCDADDGCDDDDDCDEEDDDAGTSGGDEAAASSTSSSPSTTNARSSEYRRAPRVDLLSVRSELGAGTTGVAVAAGVDDVDEDCDDDDDCDDASATDDNGGNVIDGTSPPATS